MNEWMNFFISYTMYRVRTKAKEKKNKKKEEEEKEAAND